MSQDDRRRWISRVFGSSSDPRAEGTPARVEATAPSEIIRQLELEIARLRTELESSLRELEGLREVTRHLDAARQNAETAQRETRSAAEQLAARLAASMERAAQLGGAVDEQRARADNAETLLGAAQEELAKERDALGRARTDLTGVRTELARERARAHTLATAHKQLLAASEQAQTQARAEKAALEAQRDGLANEHRSRLQQLEGDLSSARAATASMQYDRDKQARALRVEQEALQGERRARAEAERALEESNRRWAQVVADRGRLMADLVMRACDALTCAFGERGEVAISRARALGVSDPSSKLPAASDAWWVRALNEAGLLERLVVETSAGCLAQAVIVVPTSQTAATALLLRESLRGRLHDASGRELPCTVQSVREARTAPPPSGASAK